MFFIFLIFLPSNKVIELAPKTVLVILTCVIRLPIFYVWLDTCPYLTLWGIKISKRLGVSRVGVVYALVSAIGNARCDTITRTSPGKVGTTVVPTVMPQRVETVMWQKKFKLFTIPIIWTQEHCKRAVALVAYFHPNLVSWLHNTENKKTNE